MPSDVRQPVSVTVSASCKRVVLTFLALLSGLFGMTAVSQEAPWRVLVLYGYDYALPATAAAAEGIRARLQERSQRRIELDAEYLDLARYSNPGQERLMASFLRERYAQRLPDAVLAMGPDTMPFVARNRDEFAPGVPAIVLGLWDLPPAMPAGLTGHRFDLEADLRGTLALAERLQPDAKRLYVIAGSGSLDRHWRTVAQRVIAGRERKLEVIYLFDRTYDELAKEVARLPREAIVLALSVFSDASGKFFTPFEVATTLSRVSPAPVYTPYVSWIDAGVVGGFGETFESMGSSAADVLLEVLGGRKAADIPPRVNPDKAYRVDYRALQRWDLPADRLPPGTLVSNRQPTLWEAYRWYIVGALALLLFQSLLIAGLFVQRSRRRAAEAGVLAREGELRRSYEQVRHLAGRLISAQEKERTRIARELHDDVGQRIASLSIGLSALRRRPPGSGDVREDLARLQQQSTELARDLRKLSHELHPGALEHLGLAEALRARCDELREEAGVDMQLDVADAPSHLSDEIELCLYRVAQEMLRNVARHARAKSGRITLTQEGGDVLMRIGDDGQGFVATGPGRLQGIGLLSVRERVRMLGGSFETVSSPGEGTVAIVRIPQGETT